MLGRYAAMAALVALAGCAGWEPAGRNATQPEPIPAVAPARAAPILPPPRSQSSQRTVVTPPAYTPPMQQQAQAAPPVAAPSVAIATPPPTPAPDDDNVTVTGPVARQVLPPRGDPRSVAERREDVSNWDHCVMQVQATYQGDPMEPETQTPEDVCAHQLGMSNRNAVPASRLISPR